MFFWSLLMVQPTSIFCSADPPNTNVKCYTPADLPCSQVCRSNATCWLQGWVTKLLNLLQDPVTSHVWMRYIFPCCAVSWYGRAPISLHHELLWQLVLSQQIQGEAVHGSLPIKGRLGFAVRCGVNAAVDRQLILQAAAKRVAVGRVRGQRGTQWWVPVLVQADVIQTLAVLVCAAPASGRFDLPVQ